VRSLVSAVLVIGIAGVASAQQPPATPEAQKQSRYQIGQMERMLEGAVEHAAKNTRDRLQAVVPTSMLVSENSRDGLALSLFCVHIVAVPVTLERPIEGVPRSQGRGFLFHL